MITDNQRIVHEAPLLEELDISLRLLADLVMDLFTNMKLHLLGMFFTFKITLALGRPQGVAAPHAHVEDALVHRVHRLAERDQRLVVRAPFQVESVVVRLQIKT